jgi:tryptophan synthase alpha subunit
MTNRIDTTLAALKASGTTALAPFVSIGYPNLEVSIEVAKAALEAGGDMLELGVPFSDPLADGPTIQKTSAQALAGGVTVRKCLETVTSLRDSGIQAPLVLMGYMNPFLHYGLESFVKDAAGAGADGLIVADLPPEEAGPLQALCKSAGMHLIPLLAPTSTEERIKAACAGAGGFIYCVSFAGVTGARGQMAEGVRRLVKRIKTHSDLPVLVGFGVSTSKHVNDISKFADGAVFASAMLDAVGKAPPHLAAQVAGDYVRSLRGGTGASAEPTSGTISS